ncbi:pantoate--beta-alanine ligase [Viridibacillus arvi]|uniref:pantoate--beta-alanine ligase n=1 Tax=Viridibacillus arvi TaxID=263475 RepID=UPI00187BBEBB|nr:pantoate--beta-alanine ligase [Viridibacillus sp. JNUCC-6]QOV11083.1 pantoate--beta-alanine ligase [Viridibacillus sp. JNUCC-6]
MKIVSTIKELTAHITTVKKADKTIGLVPTMGYLHEGHMALATAARRENDIVVMSLFVNPAQFGPNEDYESYPRDLNRDSKIAEEVGVDFLFAPSVSEMYPTNGGIQILAGPQSNILCGATRPGHFDGVLKIVTKLFHITQPTKAYFGQKDAQQLALIETLARDYNFPLEIRSVPIVREEDGLAKSSRNVFLTEQQRKEAVVIHQALILAKNHYFESENNIEATNFAKEHIIANSNGQIDYLQMLSYPDLTEVAEQTEKVLIAAAVYFGKTRLIDNIIFQRKGE